MWSGLGVPCVVLHVRLCSGNLWKTSSCAVIMCVGTHWYVISPVGLLPWSTSPLNILLKVCVLYKCIIWHSQVSLGLECVRSEVLQQLCQCVHTTCMSLSLPSPLLAPAPSYSEATYDLSRVFYEGAKVMSIQRGHCCHHNG